MPLCSPEEIALKSFFLGPQSENAEWARTELNAILDHYFNWRRTRFPDDGRAISPEDTSTPEFRKRQTMVSSELHRLMQLFEAESPKFTPRYIGHMVSEIALPALLGHFIALLYNPNNISKEVAQVSSRIEREAIEDLLSMVGFNQTLGRGHFTAGGTIANIEALWRARYRLDHWLAMAGYLKTQKLSNESLFSLAHCGWDSFNSNKDRHQVSDHNLKKFSLVANNPWDVGSALSSAFKVSFRGPVVLVPGNKHYSWQKGVSLLGLGDESFWSVSLDTEGRLDVDDLKNKIEYARLNERPILAVVSVAGTTELGEVDPTDKVQDLLDNYKTQHGIHIWHHVDGAYGGYYRTLIKNKSALSTTVYNALNSTGRVDSITVDPHKLGYVPYTCGAILVQDEERYTVSSFKAPYINPSGKKETWSSTLEGSRTATGAIATWLASRCIGLDESGYGKILYKGILARDELKRELLIQAPNARVIEPTDTNIVCFCIAKEGDSLSKANKQTDELFKTFSTGNEFGVSNTQLYTKDYESIIRLHTAKWKGACDSDHLTLIRTVLMNPFITSKETSTNFINRFATMVGRVSK